MLMEWQFNLPSLKHHIMKVEDKEKKGLLTVK